MKLFRKQRELVIIRNPLNPTLDDIEQYTGHDLDALIRQAFPQGITDNIRFYHGGLLKEVFVERETKQDVDKLLACEGRIYAVVKPMGMEILVSLAVGLLVSVATMLLMPKPVIPTSGGQAPSPNNALAQRSNKQRLGGRVPDIFGEVWSVPDLISPTYSVYINHQETEYSFMCVGRGQHLIKAAYDDTTPITQINGATVEVYNPYRSVYGEPDFKFGTNYTPTEQTYSRLVVKRYTSVNGQVLAPPDNSFKTLALSASSEGMLFAGTDINFTGQFEVGGTMIIDDADKLASGNNLKDANGNPITYNLNGEYRIKAIDTNKITLDNAQAVNDGWKKLNANTDFTKNSEFTLSNRSDNLWQGWFYTDNSDFTHIMLNVVAPNGLYISGTKNADWQNSEVEYIVQVQILDKDDHLLYDDSKNYIIKSRENDEHSGWTKDDDVRRSAAQTLMIAVPNRQNTTDKIRFRIRRLTTTIIFKGTPQVQEIRIKDFYSARYLTGYEQSHDATTVYVKQKATEGALSVKERKLRLLVQRYVRNWQDNDNLILSKRADDIFYHIATDPKLGNLAKDKVNMVQIKGEIDSLIANFGTSDCSEFCYTFDDNKVSAEEMLQTVAKAVFCQAYRFNNRLQLIFERKVPVSVAIFNSHNILPDSYTKSESFGATKDFDGVTVNYTNPDDDSQANLSTGLGLVNPDKVDLIGVRNKTQAYMHMMRAWNKHQFSYKSCEFTGGDESGIVVRSNRITVADQLRADIQQGSVENIEMIGSDIVLRTTNPVSLDVASTIFVQTVDGNVDAIPCVANDSYSVKLSRLPSGQVSVDYDSVVRATYQIVKNSDKERDAYLVTEKAPDNGMCHKLTCINYTDKYYQNDSDFITNSIPT